MYNIYPDHILNQGHLAKYKCVVIEIQIAEDGFDPSTSGLWAQQASAAPLCYKMSRFGCLTRPGFRYNNGTSDIHTLSVQVQHNKQFVYHFQWKAMLLFFADHLSH